MMLAEALVANDARASAGMLLTVTVSATSFFFHRKYHSDSRNMYSLVDAWMEYLKFCQKCSITKLQKTDES